MKFIKPSDWITPEQNAQGMFGDCFPPGVHAITAVQAVTYPVAAVVSGIGALFSRQRGFVPVKPVNISRPQKIAVPPRPPVSR